MYKVSVKKMEDEKILGLASITVDDNFVFNNIRLVKSKNTASGFYLSMPSYKNKDGEYVSFFNPMTKEMNDLLVTACIKALEAEKAVVWGQKESDIDISVKESKLNNAVADATMYINGDFVCSSIHLNQNKKTKELYVAMPSYQTKDGEYKDYCHPITAEFKKWLDNEIIDKYQGMVIDKQWDTEKTMKLVDEQPRMDKKMDAKEQKYADSPYIPLEDAPFRVK